MQIRPNERAHARVITAPLLVVAYLLSAAGSPSFFSLLHAGDAVIEGAPRTPPQKASCAEISIVPVRSDEKTRRSFSRSSGKAAPSAAAGSASR